MKSNDRATKSKVRPRMFILLAGADGALEPLAGELRGGVGAPRIWRDDQRRGGAAALAADFVPEDRFEAQPIVDDERVFVSHARLDNRDELGDSAVADSALFAAAYDRWGERCVDHIVGDFAFAAWHRHEHKVVAAVDPLGNKRLFFARIGSGIALSTQLPALLAHPAVSRELDLDSLARLLAPGIDRASTPFRSIRALPGGHLLVWRNGELTIERWWNPDSQPSLWYRDARDYAAETRELLTRAVAAQVRSSGPISMTLSGGLDSGCVTAIAASAQRVTAYTSIPEPGLEPSQRANWEADDRAYATEVAGMYGNIDHHLITPGGLCAAEVVPSIHERSRTALKSATNMLWLDRIARSAYDAGSRVLLVGQNGNSAFSWRGEGSVTELAAGGRLRAALSQARSEANARNTSLLRILGGATRLALRAWSRRKAGADVHSPAVRFLRHPPALETRANEFAEVAGTRRFWSTTVTTPKHTWWPDPVLQWGVEWRDPTTDRRLLERLLRYPQSAFRLHGSARGLAREVANGLLPDRVRLRSTQGAQVPEAPALIAAHAGHYRDALDRLRGSDACRELLHLDLLERTLDEFRDGSLDYYLALAFDRAIAAGLFAARFG